MTAATFLGTAQNDILDKCFAALSKDRTGNDVPARQNVSWGTPPNDAGTSCGQLTINLDALNAMTFDWVRVPMRQDQVLVPWAHFVITLFRCVPTMGDKGTPPLPDELTASANKLNADLWALTKGIMDNIHNHTLYTGQVVSDNVRMGTIKPLSPSGGYAGFELRISILLDNQGPT